MDKEESRLASAYTLLTSRALAWKQNRGGSQKISN